MALRNFYLDPTHRNPIPPPTLRFLVDNLRFKNVTVRYSAEVPNEMETARDRRQRSQVKRISFWSFGLRCYRVAVMKIKTRQKSIRVIVKFILARFAQGLIELLPRLRKRLIGSWSVEFVPGSSDSERCVEVPWAVSEAHPGFVLAVRLSTQIATVGAIMGLPNGGRCRTLAMFYHRLPFRGCARG